MQFPVFDHRLFWDLMNGLQNIHCSKTGIAKEWQKLDNRICKEAPTLSQEQDKVAETTGGDIGCETSSAMKAAYCVVLFWWSNTLGTT